MPARRSCAIATVSYSGHFRVLLQFYLSYAMRVTDPAACHLFVLVSTAAEAAALSALLRSPTYESQLSPILKKISMIDFPTALTRLSPNTTTSLPSMKNRGQWGRLYVCAKKAFAARWAHEVLDAEHVIVTDSEAYVWKTLSIGELVDHAVASPTVWYADAPIHHKDKGVAMLAAKADVIASNTTSSRLSLRTAASEHRLLLHQHPHPHQLHQHHQHQHQQRNGTQRAMRAQVYGNSPGDRPAPIDPKWCSLHVYGDARGITRTQLQRRVPSYTSTLFENMLFFYPRDIFRDYWREVEAAWGRPWFDALVAAHQAEPRCVGVGFWLEVSWHLFLYERRTPPYTFRNVTAAIEKSFGPEFPRRGSYIHSRLELLWRAVANDTFAGFVEFYEREPLPFFRYEHRSRSCVALRLIAEVPAPAASFQANSAVPNWVFGGHCRAEVARLEQLNGGKALPWVEHRTST